MRIPKPLALVSSIALITAASALAQQEPEGNFPEPQIGMVDSIQIDPDVVPVSGYARVEEVVVDDGRLSAKQRKELWVYGTITDSEGQVWNILVVPGTRRAGHFFVRGWGDAGRYAAKTVSPAAWREYIIDPIAASVRDTPSAADRLAKSAGSSLKNPFVDMLNDWKSEHTRMREEHRELGDARPLGYRALQILNGLRAGIRWSWEALEWPVETAFRLTFYTGIGRGTDLAYNVAKGPIAATAAAAWLPVAIAYNGAIEGVLVPGTYLVWNGISWSLAFRGEVPTRESHPWVTRKYDDYDVPQDPAPTDPPAPTELVIDARAFNAVIEASIRMSLADARVAELQAEIGELQKRIQELGGEQKREREEAQNSEANRTLQNLISASYQYNKVRMDEGVTAVFNDEAELQAMLDRIAQDLDVSISDEMKSRIISRIQQEVSRILQ